MLAVCVGALWVYAGPQHEPSRHELNIQPGASALIAAGGNPLDLPATWNLVSGDQLVIINHDSVAHSLGSWTVAAGGRLETVLRPNIGPLLCTLHPSGSIVLDVHPARTDWGLPFKAALLLGVPLGAVGALLARIMRSIEDPAASPEPISPAPISTAPISTAPRLS